MDKGKLMKAFGAAAAGVGGAVGLVIAGHIVVPVVAVGSVGAGLYYGYKKLTEKETPAAKPKPKPKKGSGPK